MKDQELLMQWMINIFGFWLKGTGALLCHTCNQPCYLLLPLCAEGFMKEVNQQSTNLPSFYHYHRREHFEVPRHHVS